MSSAICEATAELCATFSFTSLSPWAACATLPAISSVAALCSATAPVMVVTVSFTVLITSVMVSIWETVALVEF